MPYKPSEVSVICTAIKMNNKILLKSTFLLFLLSFWGSLQAQTRATKTWNGSSNRTWDNAANWTPAGIPTAADNVVIPDASTTNNINRFNSPGACNNLTIQAGGQLEIKRDVLHVHGNLLIESATGNGIAGSLRETVSKGDVITVDGTVTIQRNYTANGHWQYIASPVKNTISNLFTNSGANFNANFLHYNEAYDCATDPAGGTSVQKYEDWTTTDLVYAWENHHNGDGGAGKTIAEGKGYAFYNDVDNLVSFTGNTDAALSKGDITIPITYTANDANSGFYDGWNLLGNPYASGFKFDDRSAAGLGDIEKTIYLWDGPAKNYKYYNYDSNTDNHVIASYVVNGTTLDPNYNIIPPGQAFFVKALPGASSFFFHEKQRRHTDDNMTRSTPRDNLTQVQFIKLRIEDHGYSDETVIRFIDNATIHHDPDFDAYKLNVPNPEVPQIYSFSQEDLLPMAINTLPGIINENYTLGVAVRITQAGKYTLKIADSYLSGANAILEDTQTNQLINLNSRAEYIFMHSGGINENRFLIHFTRNSVGIENIKPSLGIYPNPTTGSFALDFNQISKIKSIQINNVTGQQIYYKNQIKNKLHQIDLGNQKNGVYFITIVTDDETYTQKIIIKK